MQQLPTNWSQYQIVQPLSNLIDEDPAYRFDVQEARMVLEGGTAWYAAQRATAEDLQNIRACYEQIAHFQILVMTIRRQLPMPSFIWQLPRHRTIWCSFK